MNDISKTMNGLKILGIAGLSAIIISGCGRGYKKQQILINKDTTTVQGIDPVTDDPVSYNKIIGDTVTYKQEIGGIYTEIEVRKKNGVKLEFWDGSRGFSWSIMKPNKEKMIYQSDETKIYNPKEKDWESEAFNEGMYRDGYNSFQKLKALFGETSIDRYRDVDPKQELKDL